MKSFFRVELSTLLIVWDKIRSDPIQMEHLLYGLYFLKVYPTESVACGVFRVQEKTWRKWVKIVIKKISLLKLVSINNNIKS